MRCVVLGAGSTEDAGRYNSERAGEEFSQGAWRQYPGGHDQHLVCSVRRLQWGGQDRE